MSDVRYRLDQERRARDHLCKAIGALVREPIVSDERRAEALIYASVAMTALANSDSDERALDLVERVLDADKKRREAVEGAPQR